MTQGLPTVVLDSDGLSKLAMGDMRTLEHLALTIRERARVLVPATALTEVLRGGPRDAAVHRVLKRVEVVDVSRGVARAAGELIGRTPGATALDAVVAVVAIAQPDRTLLLTSDVSDLRALTEGSGVTVIGV